MRNIDLIECAMRRLNLQYDVPFKLLDGKELYKIIKEDNKIIKEINLLFCNEFTHMESLKKIIKVVYSIFCLEIRLYVRSVII